MTRFNKDAPRKTPKPKVDLKRVLAASEELLKKQAEIIEGHNKLVEFTDNSVKRLQQIVDEISGVLAAVCQVVGVEQVSATFKQMQTDEAIKKAKLYDEELKKGLEAGTFIKQEAVDEASLVVSTVTDANGNTIEPARVHARYGAYLPETKEQFLGKTVGFKVSAANGNTIEILEIYGDVAQAPVAQDPPQA